MARILIYALGGGWGHLTRSLALARAAARRGHSLRVVSNSARAQALPPAELSGFELEALSPELNPAGSAQRWRELLAEPWDALVVDTFPRGLGGELADLLPTWPGLRVLVHRDLDPRYVERYDLAGFARHFERVLIPGEDPPLAALPQALRTAPWLIRDASECCARQEARARWGASERPLVVVCASGPPGEEAEAAEIAEFLGLYLRERADVRLAAGQPWPLLEVLAGVDLLIGGGGYNLVHEARASGTPLLAFPRARRYDRQALRLSRTERASINDLGPRVRLRLSHGRPPVTPFENGVHAALDQVEADLRERGSG